MLKTKECVNVTNKNKNKNRLCSTEYIPLEVNSNYDKDYVYYYIITEDFTNLMDGASKGTSTSHQRIDANVLLNSKIMMPEYKVQQKISKILKEIDSKIELNNKINKNLEEQAYQLYIKNLLNLDSKITKTLDEFCNIFTGKRNANESEEKGLYNFYTCAPEVLKINSYIYDGPAIIITGNGAYTGRTAFYNGKFDLYQRTYACTIKKDINEIYIFLLYWMIKFELTNKISGGNHGSAIPYIVYNDIAKYSFSYDKKIFDKISTIFHTNLKIILKNNVENEALLQIRNKLLPKLMSGEIDVSKIDI